MRLLSERSGRTATADAWPSDRGGMGIDLEK
jgi:hypothetical protein